MATIYKLTFGNGKIYIGMTTGSLVSRLAGHKKVARKSGCAVHAAWRVHGEPSAEIIASCAAEHAAFLEQSAIWIFDSKLPNGYNMTDGGEKSPAKEPAVREKMSLNNAMKRPAVVAKRFANGHHMKEENQRASARKRQLKNNSMSSESSRAKSSASHKGKKHSEETKLKMSAAHKGKDVKHLHTAEVRQKRGAAISAGWARRAERKFNDQA